MDHFRSRKYSKYRIRNALLILAGLFLAYSLITSIAKKQHTQTKDFHHQEISLPELPKVLSENISKETASNSLKYPQQTHSVSSTIPLKEDLANKNPDNTNIAAKPENAEPKITTITLKQGESLATIFKKLNLSNVTLQKILQNNPEKKALTNIKSNQKLEFVINKETLEKLTIPLNIKENLVISLTNDNKYQTKIEKRKTTTQNSYISATVNGSIYKTAKKSKIPYKLISQMSDIFSWEIDFSKDVRSGDQFTILYKTIYIEDQIVDVGEILAVNYKKRNKTYTAIRHQTKNGNYEYFNAEGESLKKAFSRYPIKFSHISSPFSLSRLHPVLNVRRPHKGVDLAAPLGTAIKATGDGRIKIIEAQGGYGNMIKIEHNKTYSSVYAHLLKFKKGLSVGSYVKRGDIIGYVGQTGTATGPHCHYEFHVNKQPKNPTTVTLPRAQPIPKTELMAFKTHAQNLLSHMQLYEDAKYASNESNNKHT